MKRVRAARACCCSSLFGVWEVYVDLGGVDPVTPAAAPCQSQAPCTPTARCCGATSWSPREEVLLGILLVAAVLGLALAIAIHFSRDAAARRLSAARRLAGDPVPDAGAVLLVVARVRHPAEARRDRARLVLLDRRRDARRARGRRPATAQADADVRRDPAADVPPRRAAGGASRACSPGAKIAVAVAVIGAVLRRADRRLERRDSATLFQISGRPTALVGPRGVADGRDPVPVRDRAVRTDHARRAARAAVGL